MRGPAALALTTAVAVGAFAACGGNTEVSPGVICSLFKGWKQW